MSEFKHPKSQHSSKDPSYKHGPYGGKNDDALSNEAVASVLPQEKTIKARPKK